MGFVECTFTFDGVPHISLFIPAGFFLTDIHSILVCILNMF
jgi:hypothetical protein